MKVTANATRSGEWWAVEVPEVPGVYTQAKRLDQVAAMAADAVATMLDVDPAEVEVEIEPILSDDHLREIIVGATVATKEAVAAQEVASRRTRAAVIALRDKNFTTRDVAKFLKISPQRVSQLEKSAR